MHLSPTLFDAHTHAYGDTPMCMHLTTHSLTPTHTCPGASNSTHRHMHTPMCMNLCTCSLSLKHTHAHANGQAPVYQTSLGHIQRYACSHGHVHESCACSSHLYPHTLQKAGPCAWALFLSQAHTQTCTLIHPCTCTCPCIQAHKCTYTHVSYMWDTRGTDWP